MSQAGGQHLHDADGSRIPDFETKGEEAVLSMFEDIADKWKEHRAAAGTTDAPLKVAFFKCIALELHSRAKQMVENKLEELAKMGWLAWNQADCR